MSKWTAPQSAQHFVRALKAPADPPVAGGPLKIDIAEQAWHDASFRLPNKAELVTDWLLSKFFRERGNVLPSNALASERYWKLLSNALSSNSPKAQGSSVTQPNSWLKPMLGHISVAPIVVTFLNLCDQLEPSRQLLAHASYCISILYPLGTQKLTVEALLESWGVFLKNSSKFISNLFLIKIGIVLTKGYGDALSNCSSRKKVNSLFVQNDAYFEPWLERLNTGSGVPQYEHLRHSILSAGVETIFNIDTLRQISESPETTPIFVALASALQNHRTALMKTLPQLFTHYVASLKKHWGLINPSSTSQTTSGPDLNAASMKFFTSCQKMLDTRARDVAGWDAVTKLTEIVGRESLFDSESGFTASLNQNVEISLDYFLDGELETTTAIARCLSATSRVDYDLVIPSMSRIFSRLLQISQSHTDHFVLLDLLLEYHIKTRTVNQYIETFLSCLSPKSTSSPFSTQERYTASLSGPLLHRKHLERLSKTTQQFLTPSQCYSTVEHLCETLKSLKDQHKTAERQREADHGKGSRKSLKLDVMAVDQPDSANLALSFALSSKLAQTILGYLPITSVPQQQADQLKVLVAEFQTDFVQHDLPKLLKDFGKAVDATEAKNDQKKLKRKEAGGGKTWGTQVVLISLLRLRYALGMTRSFKLPANDTLKLPKRLLGILDQFDDELLPELSLEIFRTLLDQAFTATESEVRESIDYAMRFLDKRLLPNMATAWSGNAHELDFGENGRAKSGLALLHLLLERCLPVIDVVASGQQLDKLAQIITQIPLNLTNNAGQHEKQHLTANHLLFRALRSAQFWELHNLRSHLLSCLVDVTSSLDQEQVASELSSKKTQKRSKTSGLAEVVSTYQLLLFFPVEYLSKSCRAELVKRAIKADWTISHQPRDDGAAENFAGLSVIRTFLKRSSSFLGSIEHQTPSDIANFILHLLEDIPSARNQTEYAQTTLDLCDLYTTELFKQSIRGDAGESARVLASYIQYPTFDDLCSIKAKSLVSLVNLLTKEFTISSFPPELQTTFRDLHLRSAEILQIKLVAALNVLNPNHLSSVLPMLTYWHALLSLGRWLGVNSLPCYFGMQLVQKFSFQFFQIQCDMPSEWTDDTAVMIMAILLQELHYCDENLLNDQLELTVAGHVSYRRVLSSSGQTQLDDFVTKTCRQFSPPSFEYVLKLVEEALSGNSDTSTSSDLVHLETIFFRVHPPNTLRIMQAFFTRCLDIFTDNEDFVTGPVELRVHTLDFIAQHCSERPAALRSLDIGNIWSLLSKYLSPSTKHDKTTESIIFHKIIAVLSAIIRLRRDLAAPMLPHLGMLLRQLILGMRRCRPQLASKQTAMVMSTQPRWICAAQALGVDEARSLSRVLETLTTKTTTRVHNMPSAVHKSESLAGPFSKHAAYVLKAYIDAMNDPLCVLTREVRKELYPGLYALCSMIGKHSRDALVVSALDVGGKATMKALWKEYEKQRYVGKG